MIKRAFELAGLFSLVVGTSCLFAGCADDNKADATKGSSAQTTTSGAPGTDPLQAGAAGKEDIYKNYPGTPPTSTGAPAGGAPAGGAPPAG